jgi:hypothetical protein
MPTEKKWAIEALWATKETDDTWAMSSHTLAEMTAECRIFFFSIA